MNNQTASPQEIDPGDIHASKESVFAQEDTIPGKAAIALHNYAAIITIPLMTIFICTEVVMRYAMNSGLNWSQEASGIMLFTLVLCCQANCWQQDRHIRMDLIYNASPSWFKRISDTLTIVCGGIFYGTIAIQAIQEIPYQISINESTDEMHIPLWLLNCIIIVSCSLLVLLLLRHATRLTTSERE